MKMLIKTKFNAAHTLSAHPGKCSKLHGHTWGVECGFCVDVSNLPPTNMVVDFLKLKSLVDGILPDHTDLNAYYTRAAGNPTAEYVARALFLAIHARVCTERLQVQVAHVTVYEVSDFGVCYTCADFEKDHKFTKFCKIGASSCAAPL